MGPGSKREKRIAQQAAEKVAFAKKKLRQLENPNSFKRVAEQGGVHATKKVHESKRDAERAMEWSRDEADVEESWSWGPRSCLTDAWSDELEPFLVGFSAKTWVEIYQERTGGGGRRQKHIYYDVSQICDEAQYRLLEINRDDIDVLFRFRLSGPKRLYGIVQAHIFFVLWWDPAHKIYPVDKE